MSIVTRPAGGRVQVKFNGEVIADTRSAVALEEGSYAVVYYIPREDVRMERLERTSHWTHCPYKGVCDHSFLSICATLSNATYTSVAELLARISPSLRVEYPCAISWFFP